VGGGGGYLKGFCANKMVGGEVWETVKKSNAVYCFQYGYLRIYHG